MDCPSSLSLLARQFPCASSVMSQIALLQAKLTLPRGRVHLISDVHGDDRKLRHVVNNASGGISTLVDQVVGDELTGEEKAIFLAFLYYPVEKMRTYEERIQNVEWRLTKVKKLLRLQFRLVRHLARTVTKEELLGLMKEEFRVLYIALLDEVSFQRDPGYVDSMVDALADYDQDIVALHEASRLVRNLVVSEVVVAGDLFDRGERGDRVIHYLRNQPKVSFTWGNHDIIWMGATLGSEILIATVLRISLRYLRLWQLEEGYGILLSPLAHLAQTVYGDDEARCFYPKRSSGFIDEGLVAKMHKAVAILEFKLAGPLLARHPEWRMEDRRMLHRIDYEAGTVEIDGQHYALKDTNFPTIDPADPYALSGEEENCLARLRQSFVSSQRLWEHMLFVVKQGGMSLTRDEALVFHGCVPTNEDGTLREVLVGERCLKGGALFRELEEIVRRTYREGAASVSDDLDYYYWLWANGDSPLFGKTRMTTFERYFIADKETHVEVKDPYFGKIHDADFCRMVGREFGMGDDVLIINGHVPVKVEKGEDPVKRGGNAVTIDGAFSEAYGDRGYTLVMGPNNIRLAEHSHFESIEHFLANDDDMIPKLRELRSYGTCRTIGETRESEDIAAQLTLLNQLLQAYRSGAVRELKS
ncbi:fructose-bisphosphatase class III [Roseibacillus ishigakijimensis]|uniref:Fructose-bisphosphatase class III n=1 Tax=Roseibacillus ishigakijimensis TaxID=454146 RepID=A0A934RQV6_9BACT|nr:fructose-bisphosphatase class III [Roseibacillus ishigakijimensis]MBK1833951.1 fructose-bisphosphatase class III [Roseibacillus ishigakijimensis]